MFKEGIKRKIIHYLIPLAALLVFIFIMQGGIYKLGSQNNKNEVCLYKGLLTQDIQNEQWAAAADDLNKLEKGWIKLIPRLEFHAEMNAIEGIEMSLGRLEGWIAARDKGGALAELGEINELLNNLTD